MITTQPLWAWRTGLILLFVIPAVSQNTGANSAKRGNNAPPRATLSGQTEPHDEPASRWRKWLDEDVVWIVADEERNAFLRLNTEQERAQFVEQFWLRRDPTPDTIANEYKDEHYRRIAYANEHFGWVAPGWKTDRGRIYIRFGPPYEINSHPSATYERPASDGGGIATVALEDWRYRYIDGIGNDVTIEFVDATMTGDYRIDPSIEDYLRYVPGAELTLAEQLGLTDRTTRFANGVPQRPAPLAGTPSPRDMKIRQPPAVRFRDLEADLGRVDRLTALPMQVRVDYLRATEASVIANITVAFENRDLQFRPQYGALRANVNLLGRLSNRTGGPVQTFECSLEVKAPPAMLQKYIQERSVWQKTVPLMPGPYDLKVVAKDTVSGNLNNYQVVLEVPGFDDDKLVSSSLILADAIERLPASGIALSPFAIGDSKVLPHFGNRFKKDEKVWIYMQVYNFGSNKKTHRPSGAIEYELDKAGTNENVVQFSEDVTTIRNASPSEVILEKPVSLSSLAPGDYIIRIKATDKIRNKTVAQQANFSVN